MDAQYEPCIWPGKRDYFLKICFKEHWTLSLLKCPIFYLVVNGFKAGGTARVLFPLRVGVMLQTTNEHVIISVCSTFLGDLNGPLALT